MSFRGLLSLLAPLTLVACSNGASLNAGYASPAVSEGAYVSSKANAIVPAIVLKKNAANDLVSYVMLSYTCKDKSFANFGTGGTVFSAFARSVPLPTIYDLSEGCNVVTSATAESSSSIKVTVKLNGVVQEDITLNKSDNQTATQRIQTAANVSDKASVEEASCQGAFQVDSCASLGFINH